MRTIEISTEVFAKIWAQRMSGEETEDQILSRLLGLKGEGPAKKSIKVVHRRVVPNSPPERWRDDVREGLRRLGGSGHLKDLYHTVRSIRRENGRTVPANLEAIVRRELEYNSSDAGSYQGKRDWFLSVEGIGSGVWALRDTSKP